MFLKYDINKGDMYQLGGSILLCDDATKKENILNLIKNNHIHVLFTDPPFDFEEFNTLSALFSICEENFVMCSDKQAVQLASKNMDTFRYFFTIKLTQSFYVSNYTPMFQHDLIAYFRKGKTNFNNLKDHFTTHLEENKRYAGKNYAKAYQKDINLVATFLLHYSKRGDNILDVFGGTGTPLICAEKLKRKCFMMEIDPKRCDVILQRYENLFHKKPIKIKDGNNV